MWLLIAFLAVPLIEIALFIQVGGWIGLWPTLAIVVGTAFAGTWAVRSQGRATMTDLRRRFDTLSDPSEPLAHGAMIIFAGALLLTPGFFTDAVGLSLMVPEVRRAVMRFLARRIEVQRFRMGPGPEAPRRPGPEGETVIDGDWERVDPAEADPGTRRPPHGGSGWTQR